MYGATSRHLRSGYTASLFGLQLHETEIFPRVAVGNEFTTAFSKT